MPPGSTCAVSKQFDARRWEFQTLVSSIGHCFVYAMISRWRFAQYNHQVLKTEMKLIQSNAFEL